MKEVTNFKGFGKGDIATLSDIQTQKEFNELSSDFRIIEIRTYREPGGFFTYTGYICEYQGKDNEDEPQQIMILLREMGDDYDLFVYYMDQEGDIAEYQDMITEKEVEEESSDEEGEEDTVEIMVDKEFEDEDDTAEEDEEDDSTTEDLMERFEVTLDFGDDGTSDVTWDKKDAGSTFGVESHSTESGSDTKTLAEYFTNDETHGNPHCLIEWTGDKKKGWIEIWYGCEIRPEDLEIFRTNK